MSASRLAIGMPVFNGERFLEPTLTALLDQTYTDFELVIADNASTDRTEEICRTFAARDERVRFERADANRGASWNFNRAFTLTSAELFKWAAYDDLCAPAFVERCIDALDRDPGAVLAYPKTLLIDETGASAGEHEDNLSLAQATPHERLGTLVRSIGYAHPAYGVIRSSALRRTRLLGAYPSADYVLLAELALLGRFAEVPERLFLRRVHPQMSRVANPDAASAAAWFQPDAKPGFRAEAWRLCFEHLVSIARTPLPLDERLRCAATFAATGGRRYGHHLAAEAAELARRARPGTRAA